MTIILVEGDRVRDKRNKKYEGTIVYTWYETEMDTFTTYSTGPLPNFAEVVWDLTGCTSDVPVSDLELI